MGYRAQNDWVTKTPKTGEGNPNFGAGCPQPEIQGLSS